jgi:hypothetical protein
MSFFRASLRQLARPGRCKITGMRARLWVHFWHLGLGCSCAAVSGCGGGAKAAPVEAPVADSAEPAATASASAAPTAPANVDATNDRAADSGDEAADGPAAAPKSKSAKAEDPNATREVTYVVVPDGLKISVAGVKFSVSVVAAQVGPGWGAKVSVVSTADDGKPHSLSSPKAGPLAFAGSVARKGKPEPEAFGDERGADGEQSIFGDDPTKFSRTWPAKGVRPLAIGDSLDLQIALWGLGVDTESRRPVKKFCHVRMEVGKGKPRPIVEPPPNLNGK